MLKAPSLNSSGLYNPGLQDRSDRGALHMFKNMFKKLHMPDKKGREFYVSDLYFLI